MNDKKKPLEEQNAPAKNTDNAYVQVDEKGEPKQPSEQEQKEYDERNKKLNIKYR